MSSALERFPPVIRKHDSTMLDRMWKHRTFYILLLPAVIYTLIFHYRPYVWMTMAFQDFKFSTGLLGSPFVGLKNFGDFVRNPDSFKIVRNTLSINMFSFLIGFPAPILFALFLNELWGSGFKRVVQTITYLPHFVSWIVVAGLFYRILSSDSGSINYVLGLAGLPRVAFLREPQVFQPLMISTSVWKETGWYSIIYLAALSAINQEQYDAAEVDGANRFQQTIHVTIPGMMPTVAVMLILTAGRIATGGGIIPNFESVYAMLNPFFYETGEILQVHTYIEGLAYSRYSYATAVGILQSVVALGLVFGTNATLRKVRGYGVF